MSERPAAEGQGRPTGAPDAQTQPAVPIAPVRQNPPRAAAAQPAPGGAVAKPARAAAAAAAVPAVPAAPAGKRCRSTAEELDILIRARYPIIYLISWEEERVEQCLAEIAEVRKKKLYIWTLTKG